MWIAISNAIGSRQSVGGPAPGPEPTTPLLDDYPGAAAAYSVRLLSSSYTGDCIEAYRDSDGATQAIGFDGDGALDAAAITAFGGASVVRVRTWYDQSGNSLDAAMTTASAMPIIYDGAAVLVENGKAILTGGQLDYGSTITYTNNLHSVFNVLRYDANAIYAASYNAGITNHYGANYRNGLLFERVGGITNYHGLGAPPKAFTQQVVSIIDDATNVVSKVNDVISSVSSIGPYTAVTTLTHRGEYSLSPDVKIQEQVIYLTDQSSNRLGIESNQNGYFSVYTPVNPDAATSGFLFDYSGASVAFSVRKLNNNATAALRVRRTVSPFDEQDIGFNSNGDLDTAAIAAFGGSDPLTVSAWYDQSGRSNHSTQVTAANQPNIYDGAAVITENGKPAVKFDVVGTGESKLVMASAVSAVTMSIVVKVDANAVSSNSYLWSNSATISTGSGFHGGGPSGARTGYGVQIVTPTVEGFQGTTEDFDQHLVTYHDGATDTLFQDGSSYATGALSNTPSVQRLGSRGSYQLCLNGKIQELVLWDTSTQQSNRTGIESNINTYYSIY